MSNPIDKLAKTVASSYVAVGLIALLIGATVGPAVYSADVLPQGDSDPQYIAVVSLDETIYGSSADATVEELRNIRENESIKAVVLEVDSPGGAASASEAQYMAVKRLAKEKPVVTAVQGMAASGMYYTILPTESIFVTPASLVGNVGVRTSTPPGGGVPPEMTTGPDKLTGGTADETRARVRTLKNAFVGSVMNERGDRLELSREEIAHGKIYAGARAVENGVADKIGDTETAIKKAGSLAGIDNYELVERDPASATGFLIISGSGANSTVVKQTPFDYTGVETTQYFMLYGTPERQPEVVNDGS